MPDERSSLGHVPGAKWEFDASVATVFDEMLARSIPDYAGMRRIVSEVATAYAPAGTLVLDLGCARGEAMAPLVTAYRGGAMRFLGLDVSGPMLDAARARFAADAAQVEILDADLRQGLPALDRPVGVALSVLTLQFTPIEYRLRLVQDIYGALAPGGAFLLVEKVLGASARIDQHLVALYYQRKAEAGYSPEEIERKRLSLEGVLVPLTARYNEYMLADVGFREIECIWRHLNFAAWVAVKR